MKLFIFLCVALGLFLNTVQAQINQPADLTEECKTFLGKLPANYQRGWFEVLENDRNPSGRKLSIFWYSKRKADQVPVIFFNGGPIGTDRASYEIQSPIEDRFNLGMIYMDQRGTGCSSRPPAIVDTQSAYVSSLYSSDGIVRDAEKLRVLLLGPNSKWIGYGQSYGGFILSRYIELYPNSLISAHAVSGVAATNFEDFFYYRMKSFLKQLDYFGKKFPDGLVQLEKFKSKFKKDQCIQAYTTSLCGENIYYFLADYLLFAPYTWQSFYDLAKQENGCDGCVFTADGSLSPAYVEKFLADYGHTLEFYFSLPFQLRVTALWRQDLQINSYDGSFARDCFAAFNRLASEGINVPKMLSNHCRLNVIAENENYFKAVRSIGRTEVREPMTWKHLVRVLKKHPSLKLYLYTGEFDGGATEGQVPTKMSRQLPNQIFYTHFADGDHWSYMDHSLVWQNMSGTDQILENSAISFSMNGQSYTYSTQGTAATMQLLANGPLVGKYVYVGFADQPLDAEMAQLLKGNIALVSRGKVSFAEKVKNVLAAGATAMVAGNNDAFMGRPFVPGGLDASVPIPVVMMGTIDFENFKKQAPAEISISAHP